MPETGITKTATRNARLRCSGTSSTRRARVRPDDFFNYGEAFLHKRAIEMCEYIKKRFPHIYLYTSTNGLMFTEESAKRLVHSGIDEVTFSVDGATQESYVQYRQRGKFDVAIRNLRVMAEEKRRARRDVPTSELALHPLQWNDSDEEMNRARQLATEIGVDRLSWRSPINPGERVLTPFRAGTPDYEAIRNEIWDNTGSATPFPARLRRRKSTCASGCRDLSARSRREHPRSSESKRRSRTCVHARSPRKPATDGVSSDSARSSATKTGRCWNGIMRGRGFRRPSNRVPGSMFRSRS